MGGCRTAQCGRCFILSEYIVTGAGLTHTADRIRAKTGDTAKIVWDADKGFGNAVDAISGSEKIQHADIPDYVKTEALAVAEKVKAVRTSDSIVFIAASDAHQQDSSADIVAGNLNAAQAMKALAYILPGIDFCCYLGDYTWGASTTTIAETKQHIAEISADIDEAFQGIPQFRTVGNHDAGAYAVTQNGTTIPDSELFQLIGKYCEGATYGSTVAGYCYRDFESKKLRVICLNTSESLTADKASTGYVSDAQAAWFAKTLKAVGAKSGWRILTLSHHPLDWSVVSVCANIIKAYVEGGSIVVGGENVNFANSNSAQFLCAFHGHVHCFKTAKLNSISGNTPTEFNAWRVAIPNMCFSRNNEYGQNGKGEYYGIEFGEETTYNKTAGTADDTAFVVNVLNPAAQKIYSYCFGAGYDREVFTGISSVAVTGVTLNATSGELTKGGTVTLTATVAPANASNKTVEWTSSAPTVASVVNGVVTALSAGTADITATTEDGGFTATYHLTVKAQTVDVLATYGYVDNIRLSTGSGTEKSAPGYVTIGHTRKIPISNKLYPNGLTIRLSGADQVTGGSTASPYSDSAMCWYTAAGVFSAGVYIYNTDNFSLNSKMAVDSDAKGFTLSWKAGKVPEVQYGIAFAVKGTGANLTVTLTAN